MDKIICVGKNYLDHARELGDAVPEDPVYFLKPPSTLLEVAHDQSVTWPADFELHHELELVLRIARVADRWTFSHYTFGLDMTLRDLQARLKRNMHPWEKAKVFRNSAVVGAFQPVDALEPVLDLPFSLTVNDEVRQSARGREMRWTPDVILADVARWFPLRAGDLLFTGTPAGVGPLFAGDHVVVRGGNVNYHLTVARESSL